MATIKTRRITQPGRGVRNAPGHTAIAGTPEEQAWTCLRKALIEECPDKACSVLEEGWELSNIDYINGLGFAKGRAVIWSAPFGSNRMEPKRAIEFELRWKDGVDASSLPSPELVEFSIT